MTSIGKGLGLRIVRETIVVAELTRVQYWQIVVAGLARVQYWPRLLRSLATPATKTGHLLVERSKELD